MGLGLGLGLGLPALADSGREVLEALLEHVRRLCKTRRKRVSGRPRRAEGVLAEGAPPAPALGGLGPVAWGQWPGASGLGPVAWGQWPGAC